MEIPTPKHSDLSVSLIEMLNPRSWTSFFLGSGIAFFCSVSWIGTSIANATCSSTMWLALFGVGTAVAGTSACIAAGAIAVLSTAVASGLASYGAEKGWVFEGEGAALGKRNGYTPFIDTNFGLAHNYDADIDKALNLTYGAMLERYGTKLMAVTWMEPLVGGNYTRSPFGTLDMTLGRVVTLNDNGVIRTSIGHMSVLGAMMEEFEQFKTGNGTVPPSAVERASGSETVNWLSYNTYGENMKEGGTFEESLDEDANSSKQKGDYGVDGWSESFDYYSTKFCLGASPPSNRQGQNSIIVGEVYSNSYGGVDSDCYGG